MNVRKYPQTRSLFAFLGLVALLWCAVFIKKYLLGGTYAGYPLFYSSFRFSDFTMYAPNFRDFGKPDFYHAGREIFAYPAPAALLAAPFYFLPKALAVFLATTVCAALVGAFIAVRSLVRAGLATGAAVAFVGLSLVSSYPLWYLLDRANVEIIVVITIALFTFFAWTGRWTPAAIFLGVAIALKLYPVTLLGYLVAKRRIKASFLSLATAALFSLVGLLAVGPGLTTAWRETQTGIAYFQETFVLHRLHPSFDHSLFSLVKTVEAKLHPSTVVFLSAYKAYMLLAALGGVLLFFLVLWRRPRLNQMVALSALSVLLPPMSFDYTLVNLYPAWLLLAIFQVRRRGMPQDRRTDTVLLMVFILLGVLLGPVIFPWSGQIKALALSAVVALVSIYPLAEDELSVHATTVR